MFDEGLSRWARRLISLFLFLAVLNLMGGPAIAFNTDHHRHRDSDYNDRPPSPPPHHFRHQYERHDHFFRHHHHERCRTHMVPYWDSYWGIWSQRLERQCWSMRGPNPIV